MAHQQLDNIILGYQQLLLAQHFVVQRGTLLPNRQPIPQGQVHQLWAPPDNVLDKLH